MANELKLGKLPAKIDPRTIQLSKILRVELLPPLPADYDVDAALGGIQDNNTYNNITYGDCVLAFRAHMTLRFEMFEQNILIPITDQDVTSEYFRETGGLDTGLVMLNSLNYWRKGWTAVGKTYNIYAYASVDYKKHDEVKHCIHLLSGIGFGIQVPQSALDQFRAGEVWDVVPDDGGIVGGHALYGMAYTDGQLRCMTWGKAQPLTWAFWDKYCDEAYGIVDNRDDWVENSPVDVQKLDGYLDEITQETSPSNCKLGRGFAKALNLPLRATNRRGRFYYLNSGK
jgi:hypothetical protein